VGGTVETLQTNLDALGINLDTQLQTLNEAVNGNSTTITTLSDETETRFTQHTEELGDLGSELGLVGGTVETLQTNLDALDINLDTQLQTLNEAVNGNSTTITTLSDETETRFTQHTQALGDLGLGLGLVGVTVETLQTNLDALGINLDTQLQTLNEAVNKNSTTITTLSDDTETRFTQHTEALGDLGLGLGSVGVTIETLQTNLDALDTNLDTQLQTLNEAVSGNSTAITTLSDDTHNRNALSDLSLGLGLVGATVETLEESVNALDYRVGANLRSIVSITGTGGQIQLLYSIADDNSVAISNIYIAIDTLWMSIDALDPNLDGQLQTLNATVTGNSTAITTLTGDIETRFTNNQNALSDLGLGLGLLGTHNRNALSDLSLGLGLMGTRNQNALSDLGLGLGLVGVTVETLQTKLGALDTNVYAQIQTLNDAVNGYSIAISTLDDNTETRLNQYEDSLIDLGFSVNGIDSRVGVNTTSIREITGTGGPIQSLYSIADANSTSITDLETSSAVMGLNIQTLDESVDEIESRVDGLAASFALSADLDALATAGADDRVVITSNTNCIQTLANKFVITYDGGECLDPNSYVVTRSSLWYNHENNGDYDAYKLFDGDENTVTNFIMDKAGVDGVAFTEFEMGEFVHVSGFRMKPRIHINIGSLGIPAYFPGRQVPVRGPRLGRLYWRPLLLTTTIL